MQKSMSSLNAVKFTNPIRASSLRVEASRSTHDRLTFFLPLAVSSTISPTWSRLVKNERRTNCVNVLRRRRCRHCFLLSAIRKWKERPIAPAVGRRFSPNRLENSTAAFPLSRVLFCRFTSGWEIRSRSGLKSECKNIFFWNFVLLLGTPRSRLIVCAALCKSFSVVSLVKWKSFWGN